MLSTNPAARVAVVRGWVALLGLAVAWVMAWPAPVAAQGLPGAYRFTPENEFRLGVTAQYWNPILTYLSMRTGLAIELKLGRTLDETRALMQNRQTDMAFAMRPDQVQAAPGDWQVLLRRQQEVMQMQIVVPGESSVRRLADLAGGQVALAGSMSEDEALRQALWRLSIRPWPVGNPDAALTLMGAGRVNAAGVHSLHARSFRLRQGQTMRIVWRGIVEDDPAILVSVRVRPADAAALRIALAGMAADPEGSIVLRHVTRLAGFAGDARFVSIAPVARQHDRGKAVLAGV